MSNASINPAAHTPSSQDAQSLAGVSSASSTVSEARTQPAPPHPLQGQGFLQTLVHVHPFGPIGEVLDVQGFDFFRQEGGRTNEVVAASGELSEHEERNEDARRGSHGATVAHEKVISNQFPGTVRRSLITDYR